MVSLLSIIKDIDAPEDILSLNLFHEQSVIIGSPGKLNTSPVTLD